jgi:hypothetical protein
MKKRCLQCKKVKRLTSFHKDQTLPDRHKTYCKECACAQSLSYYHNHAAERRAYTHQYQRSHPKQMRTIREQNTKRNQTLVLAAKSHPCMDCGHSFIPFVMDLDHVRGRKLFALAAHGTRSLAAVKKEIAKCDAVCSNCHRVRTWNRMQRSKQ